MDQIYKMDRIVTVKETKEGIYLSPQQLVAVTNALVKGLPQNSIVSHWTPKIFQIKDLS